MSGGEERGQWQRDWRFGRGRMVSWMVVIVAVAATVGSSCILCCLAVVICMHGACVLSVVLFVVFLVCFLGG